MEKIAIIRTGGKQYVVSEGQKLKVEKLEAEVGKTFTFDDVLLVASDKGIMVGTPKVAGAKVTANVLRTEKADKVMVVKFKAKSRYRRTKGHRQWFTEVEVKTIA